MTNSQSGCGRKEKVSAPTSQVIPSHYADSDIPAMRKSGQWCCKCEEAHETNITLNDNSLSSLSFAFMSYAMWMYKYDDFVSLTYAFQVIQ